MMSPGKNTIETKIKYNKVIIKANSIQNMNVQSRMNNDKSNKMRESIIGAILNDVIPQSFYDDYEEWMVLKKNLHKYIQKLVQEEIVLVVTCEHRGGRKHYYDFTIKINNRFKFNIEFKFNAKKIEESPQYVSPMKPSQYLTGNYEEYFYDNYLKKICELGEVPFVDKSVYLKSIHNSKPECVSELQKKYYRGCKQSSKFSNLDEDINFYKKVNEYSKESIKKFVLMEDIRVLELSNYLLNTQQNKIYMLYYQGEFFLEKVNTDNFKILSVSINKNKNGYIADTISGKKIKILLRWKNGNGIAFPAFQIS